MSYAIDDVATAVDRDDDGPVLVIRAGGGRAGEHLPLQAARETIGRAPEADLFLDDVTVSREHAIIEREPDGFYLARPRVAERHLREPHARHAPAARRRRRGAGRQVQADVPGAVTMAKRGHLARRASRSPSARCAGSCRRSSTTCRSRRSASWRTRTCVTPRRTPGGYRLYGPDEVDRLRNILRLQRDEFLPLRVIRQELQNGPPTAATGRSGGARPVVEDRQRFTATTLIAASGADEPFVRELEDFGLITAAGPDARLRRRASSTSCASRCRWRATASARGT